MLNTYFKNTLLANKELWEILLGEKIEIDFLNTAMSTPKGDIWESIASIKIGENDFIDLGNSKNSVVVIDSSDYKYKDLITDSFSDTKFSYLDYLSRIGVTIDNNDYISDWNNLDKIDFEKETISDKPRIFFDMDGVLAEFNAEKPMEEVYSEGYFKNLLPQANMCILAEDLSVAGYEVCILSKSNFSENQNAIQEKIEWLQKYLPCIKPDNYYFVPLDANKKDFIPNPSPKDILIDDYLKNFVLENENGVDKIWH